MATLKTPAEFDASEIHSAIKVKSVASIYKILIYQSFNRVE